MPAPVDPRLGIIANILGDVVRELGGPPSWLAQLDTIRRDAAPQPEPLADINQRLDKIVELLGDIVGVLVRGPSAADALIHAAPQPELAQQLLLDWARRMQRRQERAAAAPRPSGEARR